MRFPEAVDFSFRKIGIGYMGPFLIKTPRAKKNATIFYSLALSRERFMFKLQRNSTQSTRFKLCDDSFTAEVSLVPLDPTTQLQLYLPSGT